MEGVGGRSGCKGWKEGVDVKGEWKGWMEGVDSRGGCCSTHM